MRVLVVEDDELMGRSLVRGLTAEGYSVDLALDGAEGRHLAMEVDYDAVILDLMLPGANGFRVCAELRAAGRSMPILMLTAKAGDLDQEEGLDAGADDYVIKPFCYPVLLARLRALLRRPSGVAGPVLSVGSLRLDPKTRRCWRDEAEIFLTPREFMLLRYLMARPGEVVQRQELLDHVWGDPMAGDDNVVAVYVGYLRRKVDVPFGCSTILTVRGVGYLLADGDFD